MLDAAGMGYQALGVREVQTVVSCLWTGAKG